MWFKLPRLVLFSVVVGASCTGASPGSDGAGGSLGQPGGAGGRGEASGGSPGRGSGGSPATAGTGGTTSGGAGGAATGGAGGPATGGADGTGTGGSASDDAAGGGTGGTGTDAAGPGGGGTDATTPPGNGGGSIDLEGAIPPWEGPPVGPEVKMDCPEDPTAGLTEYKDTFKVEHPYDLPASARFSIDGGIYNFWVMHGDKKHSASSNAPNPRTEARWSQNFKTGIRMFSADIFWDKSVTNGTVVMQVHTTATGIGPVYMVANGGGVSPLDGSKVPGGLFDKWINLKVEIDAGTTASRYWVNNCLVTSKGSGTRGDGNDYFKIGVYHCDAGTCRAKVKNVHLYTKP